jgi:membrane fusion protein, heavy metal efflux system
VRTLGTPFATVAALALAFTCLAGCKAGEKHAAAERSASPPDTIKLEPTSPRMQFVKVEKLEESEAAASVILTGRVGFDEEHTQRVASPLDGRATAILVKPGDKVAIGQALVELSSPQVSQLQSDAQKANMDLTLAQRTVERQRKLRADGAVSEKDLLQAESDLKKLTSDVGRATAQLHALGVSASDPAVGVFLRARVAGTVVERNVLVGQEVRADATTPLLTITNLSSVWVLADVYEQDLGLVEEGAKVRIRVPAYPTTAFDGTVGHVGDVLDPASRTVKARCVVPNPDTRLKPEMFARVELAELGGKKVIVVPSRAILNDAEHSRVIVAGDDNVYRMRVVQAGPEIDGRVRLLGGVTAGERVVVEGALFLKSEIDNR